MGTNLIVGDTSTRRYGSAIKLIRAAGWHSSHNVAVVTPACSAELVNHDFGTGTPMVGLRIK